MTRDFDDIEHSLVEALGKPIDRYVGAAQNGFGAFFDTIDDLWRVGPVTVVLAKRSGRTDEGGFIMEYTPLAKGAPQRRVEAAPF
jgi:hypothetical protein